MNLEIKRKIDKLGRIVLPAKLKKHYQIANGDNVVLLPVRNGIQIAKTEYFLVDKLPKEAIVSVDELGRITIPISLRTLFNIDSADIITFALRETCMLIHKQS